jgi:hypothetical protein
LGGETKERAMGKAMETIDLEMATGNLCFSN